MNATIRRTLLFAALYTLAACRPTPPGTPSAASAQDLQWAEEGLTGFFGDLAEGRYAHATAFFAGPTQQLAEYNPDVDPQDITALLERYCKVNGGTCLPIKSIARRDAPAADTFVFVVEFLNPDGSTFVRGPCCGSEDMSETRRQWEYTVLVVDGQFRVFKLPPYVP